VVSLLVENAPTVPTTKHTPKASKLADLGDFEVLQHKIEMVHRKLLRSEQLIKGLGIENLRWTDIVQELTVLAK
jgi:hypothetical protein